MSSKAGNNQKQYEVEQGVLECLYNIFKCQDQFNDNSGSIIRNLLNDLKSKINDESIGYIDPCLKEEIPSVLYEINEFCQIAEVSGNISIGDTIKEIINKLK